MLALVTLPLAAEPHESVAAHPRVADAITLLDLWIEEQVAYQQLPGLAIGIVHGGELIWAKGYGYSDIESKTPTTPDTLYRIGSITKLFTATAVMQLRDAGKLRLDDPVARHLPWFEIKSSFEDVPEVTVWHLLTHTAGLPGRRRFRTGPRTSFRAERRSGRRSPASRPSIHRPTATSTPIWA